MDRLVYDVIAKNAAIAVVAIILILLCCDCSSPQNSYDLGLMLRNGVTVHQDDYPISVSCDSSIDCDEVEQAIIWWRVELSRYWHRNKTMPVFANIVESNADVTVSRQIVPNGLAGLAKVSYSLSDGDIVHVDVHLDPFFYSKWVLYHELGHAFWGLEDDYHSLDLNSIMCDYIIENSHLTEDDAMQIFRFFH